MWPFSKKPGTSLVGDKRLENFYASFEQMVSFMLSEPLPAELKTKVHQMRGAAKLGKSLNKIKLPGEIYYRVMLNDTLVGPIQSGDLDMLVSESYSEAVLASLDESEQKAAAGDGSKDAGIAQLITVIQSLLKELPKDRLTSFLQTLDDVLLNCADIFEQEPKMLYRPMFPPKPKVEKEVDEDQPVTKRARV